MSEEQSVQPAQAIATQQTEENGPPKSSFGTFVLKIFAGTAGGAAGSLIMILIFFLASSILTPLSGDYKTGDYVSPLFIFIIMIMIFFSSTIGNLISTWLIALTERGRYVRISSAIYQVFIISVIIFVLTAPVYFITGNANLAFMGYVVGLHVIVSAQVSALILEIVSNYRYALVGVYGVTFGVLVSAGILFALSTFIPNYSVLLFVALPIVWGSIALLNGLVGMVYNGIANAYDKDFLSTQTVYGSDYGRDVEEEPVTEAPKTQDEEGADFLRHN